MKGIWRTRIFNFVVLLGLCGANLAGAQAGPPKPPLHEQQASELKDMKDDLAKMQSLLNQMQAVFALAGNPTSPANHELELNIDMWRVLINQMERRVQGMEARSKSSNQ